MNSNVVYNLDEILAEAECFGTELKPLLIFEGKTDVNVYYKVLDKSTANINDIEIVIGGCKSKITNFHENSNDNVKYLALLDSDHGEIFKEKLKNKNILYTHFYDMENYLTTIDVVYSTYEDFRDFRIKKLNKKELLNKIINIAYPSILEAEFKVKYLKKNSVNAKIYPIGTVSPKHKAFESMDILEKRKEVKRIILKYFESNEIQFDEKLWDETVQYVEDKLCKESYYDVDEYIQKLLKGRNLMDLERMIFDCIFKEEMKNKSKLMFTIDLKKNIFKSDKCNLLLKSIDAGLNNMLS